MEQKKKTGRPRKYSVEERPPAKPKITRPIQPGDNAKYLAYNLELAALPPIDWTDEQEIAKRVYDFFHICEKHDMKATVAGLSLAFQTNYRRIWEVVTDQRKGGRYRGITPAGAEILKSAYAMLFSLHNSYMYDGKMPPVTGIFLGANYYGLHDVKQEISIQNSGNALDERKTPAELENYYRESLPPESD